LTDHTYSSQLPLNSSALSANCAISRGWRTTAGTQCSRRIATSAAQMNTNDHSERCSTICKASTRARA